MGSFSEGDYMKKMVLTAAAVALACASAPVIAKDKKDAPAPVSIDAPAGPAQPIAASWPMGATAGTPSIQGDAVLPANTEVGVRITKELNSKKMKEGDTFSAVVSSDVMLGNLVVIPKNTPVNGVITWRTGKGVYGKSAKMEYEIRSFDLNGQRYALTGKFRQEGKGNTGATVATAVVAGPIFGMFVTGKSAIVEQGRELKAFTAGSIPVGLPGGTATAAPVAATTATDATSQTATTK